MVLFFLDEIWTDCFEKVSYVVWHDKTRQGSPVGSRPSQMEFGNYTKSIHLQYTALHRNNFWSNVREGNIPRTRGKMSWDFVLQTNHNYFFYSMLYIDVFWIFQWLDLIIFLDGCTPAPPPNFTKLCRKFSQMTHNVTKVSSCHQSLITQNVSLSLSWVRSWK